MAVISAASYDPTSGSGSGQYLNVNYTGVNLRASHTIGVRFKATGTATNYSSASCYYLAQSDLSGSFIGRANGATSTAQNWTRQGGFFSYTQDTTARSTCYGNTSTWYHLCLVYNATTGQIRAYIDGTFIGQQASSTTRSISSTANGFGIIGPGKFADAFYFNRAISDSEVSDMASYRVPQVTSGLELFWRLDSDASDSSGSGRNGSTAGSGTALSYSTSDNPPQPESPAVDVAGTGTSASTFTGALNASKPIASTATSASTLTGAARQSQALASTVTSADTLTGALNTIKPLTTGGLTSASTLTGAAVQINALAGSSTDASTLSAWARPRWGRRIVDNGTTNLSRSGMSFSTSAFTWMAWLRGLSLPANGDTVYAQIQGTSFNARLGIINAAGTQSWSLRVFDGTSTTVVYGAATDSAWHHACLTYDGTDVRAYADGSLVATTAIAIAGPTATLLNIQTANSVSGCFGELAQVKLWSRKLPAGDIASEAAYNTPHCATEYLSGWWALSWQNVTLDGSGNGLTLANNDSNEAQTEAPSTDPPPLNALAGTSTSASTLTGAARQSQVLESAVSSASDLSALLGQQQPIAGSSTSASTLNALLGQSQPIAGTATSASTLTPAALAQAQALAGSLLSASTLTASAVQNYAILGNLSSASTLSGTVSSGKPLAGDTLDASTLTGAIVQLQALVGTSDSASTLIPPALGINGLYAGTLLTASTLTGLLNTEKLLAATATSASTLSGAVSSIKPLAGDLASGSSLDANLSQPIALAGDLGSASAFVGALVMSVSGTLFSGSSLLGSGSQFQPLDAELDNASALSGALSTQLSAAPLTSASTLSGGINVAGPRNVSGTATSASTLSGTLTGGGGGGGAGGNARTLRRMGALGVMRRPVR